MSMSGKKAPKVSVCVVTYNQEKYIRQCLDSILSQRTSFDFEVIVHDDASQDNTPKIIEEFHRNHPEIIIPLLQKENCYSKNKHLPFLNCANAAQSEYIAICEGDDYWINNRKLEIQFDILRKNPQATLTIAPGKIELNGKQLDKLHCWHGRQIRVFCAQDVLNTPNQFAPTASYFLKKEIIINALATFKNAPIGDLFIEIYAGMRGDIIYHPEVFSVYRMLAESSWSLSITKNRVANIQKYIAEMQAVIRRFETNPVEKKLDWSKKLAAMYYGLAVANLEKRQYAGFSSAIEKSFSLGRISYKQQILFVAKRLRLESLVGKFVFALKKYSKY